MGSFCGSDNDENDYEIGYREGAAALGGLIAMAEAIRTRGSRNLTALIDADREARNAPMPKIDLCPYDLRAVWPGKTCRVCGWLSTMTPGPWVPPVHGAMVEQPKKKASESPDSGTDSEA